MRKSREVEKAKASGTFTQSAEPVCTDDTVLVCNLSVRVGGADSARTALRQAACNFALAQALVLAIESNAGLLPVITRVGTVTLEASASGSP